MPGIRHAQYVAYVCFRLGLGWLLLTIACVCVCFSLGLGWLLLTVACVCVCVLASVGYYVCVFCFGLGLVGYCVSCVLLGLLYVFTSMVSRLGLGLGWLY